ncbi:hypothetical protein VTI74DRAFT_79 [Chaetomium olivicolor]
MPSSVSVWLRMMECRCIFDSGVHNERHQSSGWCRGGFLSWGRGWSYCRPGCCRFACISRPLQGGPVPFPHPFRQTIQIGFSLFLKVGQGLCGAVLFANTAVVAEAHALSQLSEVPVIYEIAGEKPPSVAGEATVEVSRDHAVEVARSQAAGAEGPDALGDSFSVVYTIAV